MMEHFNYWYTARAMATVFILGGVIFAGIALAEDAKGKITVPVGLAILCALGASLAFGFTSAPGVR